MLSRTKRSESRGRRMTRPAQRTWSLLFARRCPAVRSGSALALIGFCFCALAMQTLWTATAMAAADDAQIRDTGAMVVRAIGPDGLEMPGVMVTVQGPLGARTEHTGMNGTVRLPGR